MDSDTPSEMNDSQRVFLFSDWTAEKAWWWGILLGDGNVHEGKGYYRVSACGSYSTIKRWMDLIAPGKKFSEFKRSPGTYQGYVDSRLMVNYFKDEHGICGPKSENLPWPEDLPEEFLRSFLQGLWDSDGGISIFDRRAHGHAGNPEVKAGFGVDCEPFVEKVREVLERVCGAPRVVIGRGKGKNKKNHRIVYGGTSAFKVLDYLYPEAPEHLRNEDRIEMYQKACEIREFVDNACCPCGEPARLEGHCHPCWYAQTPNTTGGDTVCACGKSPILAKGMCTACYNRVRRAKPSYQRKSTGACACGKPAYRKGKCDACYAKDRRANP